MRPGLTFSVIVPVYEQPATTRMVLECLQEQKDPPSFEVIVCDDGSSPETFLACQEVVRNATTPTFWTWQQDRGFQVAKSRNNDIRLASGRYLLFFDGDHIPEEDLLERHLALHTRPGLLVQGVRRWRSLDLTNSSAALGGAAIWDLLRGDAAVNEKVREQEEQELKSRRHISKHGKNWRLITSTNLSVENRPEVYLDETFVGWGLEDTEFGYRLVEKQGFEVINARDLVCYDLQAAPNNPEDNDSHNSIVGTMRNIVHFAEKWPELREIINHSMLRKMRLDTETDLWSMLSEPTEPDEMPRVFEDACDWLRRKGLFPV